VRLWDARPLTPELKIELEARGLVERVCGQARDPDEVRVRIGDNKMISEPVRQQALALVPAYWDGRIQAEASQLVSNLFTRTQSFTPLLKEEVLAAIRVDGALMEAVRQRALELAERSPEYASAFHDSARLVVRQLPGKTTDAHRRALRQAEIASRLDPENRSYLLTLAIAQYRAGQYQEALATLTRYSGSSAEALAFLAMAQQQLGQKEQAQATLARLRQVLRKPEDAGYISYSTIREAEQLIGGSPAEAKK
jgi:tetratricopeptide (TPR) repeat protein